MVLAIFENTPLFLAGVFVFGLLIGSFLNVVILRLPARLEHDWKCQCRELLEIDGGEQQEQPPGILWDRSRCRDCGHNIRAHENIPLLSYLLLRGKCSSCGTGISIRYPVVEFATAALFLVAAWHFGPTTEGLAAILLTGFLVALTGIDVDHQLLPDILTLPLLWIGILLSLGHVFVGPESSIAGAAVGYLALWSIFWIFFGLTRLIHGEGKEGMGYGDFKLLAALGAWLGWTAVPLIIFLSAIAGAVYGGAMLALARHKLGKPMPYGPFIAAAGWVAMIWGELIIEQYLHFSGLG